MKKACTKMFMVIFAAILIICTGCSSVANNSDNKQISEFKSTKLKPFSEGVDFVVEPIFKDRKVQFIGKTNLPDESDIMFTLKRTGYDYTVQDKTKVAIGEFKSLPMGGNNLESGDYELEISTPYAFVQSNKVSEIIGKDGENLKGKYVFGENSGLRIKYIRKVKVTTSGAIWLGEPYTVTFIPKEDNYIGTWWNSRGNTIDVVKIKKEDGRCIIYTQVIRNDGADNLQKKDVTEYYDSGLLISNYIAPNGKKFEYRYDKESNSLITPWTDVNAYKRLDEKTQNEYDQAKSKLKASQ